MADSFWKVYKYSSGESSRWNDFIIQARNSTFLFNRNYMDYHSCRFQDNSLMALRNDRLMGVLPANITEDRVLHSHQGLTYGGWILPKTHIDGADVLELMKATIDYCRASDIQALDYKPLPWIYAHAPAQDDIYALSRLGASISETSLTYSIDMLNPTGFNTMQRRHLRNALKLNPVISETSDIDGFWDLLALCLEERHATLPVHSASELRLLHSRFPENIRFFTISVPGRNTPDAGVCIFDTGRVAHAQYIATTKEGRHMNLLSPLFNHLISDIFTTCRYFDFGISTEAGGQILNEGLMRQKASYGSSGVAVTRWFLPINR